MQVIQVDHENVQATSLKVVFDMLHLYGLEAFNLELKPSEEEEEEEKEEGKEDEMVLCKPQHLYTYTCMYMYIYVHIHYTINVGRITIQFVSCII